MRKTLIHFRYCEVLSATRSLKINFLSRPYTVDLDHPDIRAGSGIAITPIGGGFAATELLTWLSVYFGEDCFATTPDTRFNGQRGTFELDIGKLEHFLQSVDAFVSRRRAKWKDELFDASLAYYSAALSLGVNYAPVNLGFFALSMEAIGNYVYGKRDDHFTFGNKRFLSLLTKAIAPEKRDATTKDGARQFEKKLHGDIELIHLIRNAYYGHSLLHLVKDRRTLVEQLQKWWIRWGGTSKQARAWFHTSRINDEVQREAFGLFKTGLRLNRLFLFLVIGVSNPPPFASHDFSLIGRSRHDWGDRRDSNP